MIDIKIVYNLEKKFQKIVYKNYSIILRIFIPKDFILIKFYKLVLNILFYLNSTVLFYALLNLNTVVIQRSNIGHKTNKI